MSTVRTMAMVMLALLYLGGVYGHLSGAAFPIIGSGDNALNHFQGKASDPIRPTITDCRHLPLVKPIVVVPLFAIDQPVFVHTVEFQIVSYPSLFSPLLGTCPVSCSDRAPPRS